MYNNANINTSPEVDSHIINCIGYEPDTGLLYWKEKYSKYSPIVVGGTIGTLNSKGALHFTFLGKGFLCHRVAWFLTYRVWPDKFIDHKNGNPSDNRINNLRIATRAQNSANRRACGSSSYLGVCFAKATKLWQATIGTPRRYLGQYQDEKLAALAYDRAAKELYGEFARTNF